MATEVLAPRHLWRRSIAAAELLLCVAPLSIALLRQSLTFFDYGARAFYIGVSRGIAQQLQGGTVGLALGVGSVCALVTLVSLLLSVIRSGLPTFKAWQLVGLAAWVAVTLSLAETIDNMLGVLPFTIASALAVCHQALDAWWLRRRECRSA